MSLFPSCLNLGSGKDRKDEYFNADIQSRVNPDWVVDISKPIFGEIVKTRFGDVEIKKGMFSKIIANDVLEHIPDLVSAMTNCKDLLTKGGEFHIHVPYDLSYGAWQDPTHVRAFNEKSWLYYTEWYWYLGWTDKFRLAELQFIKSSLAANVDASDEMLKIMPRMIDSMQVVLVKE